MRAIFQCAVFAALTSCALLARASVSVFDDSQHTAVGQMATAATAGLESAYIECEMDGAKMSCFAWDGATKFAGCSTSDYNQKRLFPSIGRHSSITFTWDPVTSQCGHITVANINRNTDERSPAATTERIPPTVDVAGHVAYGTVNSPPTDAARHEQIRCSARTDGMIQCVAGDRNSVIGSCVALRDSAWQTLEDMRIAVNGINESSYVFFQWDVGFPLNTCSSITVVNASYLLP